MLEARGVMSHNSLGSDAVSKRSECVNQEGSEIELNLGDNA